MPKKIADRKSPTGLSRMLYRLPVWFFRVHLGWLLGSHFLLLNHTGRKSGRLRQAVLEIIRHDKASDTYFVVAGWGEKSDWFRNVQETPSVTIQVRSRHLNAVAGWLLPDEAGEEILNYARRFPALTRFLVRVAGYRVDGTDADYRALGRIFPVVTFAVLPCPNE